MLIEYSVKNFHSIKERQVLSTVRNKSNELEQNTFSTDLNLKLLRSTVIYGANASGKSNLIKSLLAMKQIVCNSASSMQKGSELPVTPFLFDKNLRSQSTEFEIIFIYEGIKYQYGFVASKEKVYEEWLFVFPKGRAQTWFHRIYDEDTESYNYKFSNFLGGQRKVWQQVTRSNALFLSTAIQLNSERLSPIYDWFFKYLNIVLMPIHIDDAYTKSICNKDKSKEQVLSFLKAADLDIDNIKIESSDIHFSEEIPKEIEEIIRQNLANEAIRIKTIHLTEQGEEVEIDLNQESQGTQAIFALSGPLIDILKNGYILVIDELNYSLHPSLLKHLIDLFHNPYTNPKNAQLIFSTHDTSILNKDIFRRDQIWFCEKSNKNQETILYPLTDFSPKKGRENFKEHYLSGRYGAVPYLDNDELSWLS